MSNCEYSYSPESAGTDASAHYLLNPMIYCWDSSVPCSSHVEGNAQHLGRHLSRELNTSWQPVIGSLEV